MATFYYFADMSLRDKIYKWGYRNGVPVGKMLSGFVILKTESSTKYLKKQVELKRLKVDKDFTELTGNILADFIKNKGGKTIGKK